MTPLVWLAAALVAAGGAYLVGWPAVESRRARKARDLNAERYLAWRGRARERPPSGAAEALTADERRRLVFGAALGAVAVTALVAFFVAS
jgi:hypothetical protein